MITIGDKARDVLMVIAALCWAMCIYASWVGGPAKDFQLIYFGMLSTCVLTTIYYLMGAVVNQKMTTLVLIWPVLLNGILQAIAFTLVYTTKGQRMDFILGMHPGFIGAMVFFWGGNFLSSTLSFWLLFDKYVAPDDEWESFMKDVAKLEKLH